MKAFDELTHVNLKLNQKISERDERIVFLIGEKSKLDLSFSALYKEKESLLKSGIGDSYLRQQLQHVTSQKETLGQQIVRLMY